MRFVNRAFCSAKEPPQPDYRLTPDPRHDLKERRIRVNALSPGVTETAGLDTLFGGGVQAEGTKAYLASQIPAGRVGQPEEIAKAVLFLASEDARYINGIELFVDSGQIQI